MKIIYTLALDEEGLSPEERQRLSALVGHLETRAHQWMMNHFPTVGFDTQRIAPTTSRRCNCRLTDCRQHYRVVADTAVDQERGQQILAELHRYLCQQWHAWQVESVMATS